MALFEQTVDDGSGFSSSLELTLLLRELMLERLQLCQLLLDIGVLHLWLLPLDLDLIGGAAALRSNL